MVDKNELRAGFSARLHEALDDAGVRRHGRGVDVHNGLKVLGVHKTPQAVSKWLNSEAIAEPDSIAALSSWLGVRREWLEYGVLPKALSLGGTSHLGQPDIGSSCSIKAVPLMSWEAAKSWSKCTPITVPKAKESIPCPASIGPRGFSLIVVGDSMSNAGLGLTYPAGCIIYVDPDIKAKVGARVIARVPHSEELTFKILAEDAGRSYLRPLNPQYPIIDITEEAHIIGVIIGCFISEAY